MATIRSANPPNAQFTHTSVDGSWDYVINAQGFRDRVNYSYEKPAGTLRVLALGDSHTMGYEVRQDATFSEVVKRRLAAQWGAVEVLNTGVSGYGTAEELAFLENEGLRYDPDVVVLAFFRNDFEDNLKAGLFRLNGEQLIAVKKEHLPGVRIAQSCERDVRAYPGSASIPISIPLCSTPSGIFPSAPCSTARLRICRPNTPSARRNLTWR